ncbi:hypothetical protein EYF80_009639 [Liparis tanakae]|uniref:Uncharacterized protein n=1 Tax=Liparis tanakae TaxID=230148 RepID=A0A4Z2IR92_9TELE|nr:hypothetical protein EYF80_009639 [Liparis tanakae]
MRSTIPAAQSQQKQALISDYKPPYYTRATGVSIACLAPLAVNGNRDEERAFIGHSVWRKLSSAPKDMYAGRKRFGHRGGGGGASGAWRAAIPALTTRLMSAQNTQEVSLESLAI